MTEYGLTKEIDEYRRKYNLENPFALLILDNHSSRNSSEEVAIFEEFGLILPSLPAHSSVIPQPLDLYPNYHLKQRYDDLLQQTIAKVPNAKKITVEERRIMHLRLAYRASKARLNMDSILIGWERTGMYPIDADVALRSKMVKLVDPPVLPNKRKGNGQHFGQGGVLFAGTDQVSFHRSDKENENPQKLQKPHVNDK